MGLFTGGEAKKGSAHVNRVKTWFKESARSSARLAGASLLALRGRHGSRRCLLRGLSNLQNSRKSISGLCKLPGLGYCGVPKANGLAQGPQAILGEQKKAGFPQDFHSV